jgi:hypothetical protein
MFNPILQTFCGVAKNVVAAAVLLMVLLKFTVPLFAAYTKNPCV